MKKLVSFKLVMVLVISFAVIAMSTKVFATDGVFEGNTVISNTTEVSTTNDEYINGGTIVDTTTNTANENVSEGVNTDAVYNTVDEEEKDDLPQTGIEDYNIGILLVICIGASIYTYKKMRDYKNV